MKTIAYMITLGGCSLLLANCASTQNYQVADINGDGLISDAEYRQYNMQKNVEDRNVYSEGAKRRNARDTVLDTRDAVWGASSIKNMVENF
jgi:hypothetical protein